MRLKLYVSYVIMFFTLVCSQVHTASASERSVSAVDIMMNFYRLPDPDVFPDLVKVLDQEDVFKNNSTTRAPTLYFMSEVFRLYPEKAAEWCRAFTKERPFLRYGVGLAITCSDVPNAVMYAVKYLDLTEEQKRILKEEIRPYDPTKEEYVNAFVLDVLWAMFSASGDTRYVHRVIDALDEKLPDGSSNVAIIAAEWSLEGQARQHSIVRETLIERSKTAKGDEKKAIDKILNKIKN